jgi:hypothetical protein
MKQHTVTIRMGAPYWDATINHNDTKLHFNFRQMAKRDRSDFHREFMNAFRATHPQPGAQAQ